MILADVANAFGADESLQHALDNTSASPARIQMLRPPSSWIPEGLPTSNTATPERFMEALPGLVREIDVGIVSQRLSGVWKRMMLAQFHCTYKLAQTHAHTFLQWTHKLSKQRGVKLTPKHGRSESRVKARFIDIISWQSGTTLAQAGNKVQDWQYDGKPWAEFIRRFGCGSLLLVPRQLTDERYLLPPT